MHPTDTEKLSPGKVTPIDTDTRTPEFSAGDLGTIQKILFAEQWQANNKRLTAITGQYDEKLSSLESGFNHKLEQQYDELRTDDLKKALAAIEARLNNADKRTVDTAEIIVPAVKASLEKDEQLSAALKPVLVEQFKETSRNEPEVMAEALFPIMGPAIRKMIASMFTPDKDSRSVTYRLEQLFLIDSNTGLPLSHAASQNAVDRDADMVSGMLTAIQSFVHDAFSANEFDGLNTLQVGELSVWIEWGPKAVLAAVIRGTGPQKLREAMQIKLEEIHTEYATELKQYEGDSTQFETLTPELHRFMGNHDGSTRSKIRNLPEVAKYWLLGGAAVATILVASLIATLFDKSRFANLVARVDAEPGIVVTDAKRSFRNYVISGLKDPLATDPSTLLQNIPEDSVTYLFEPYQAITSEFTLLRAHELLKPPEGATLTLKGNTLHINGGDPAWANGVSPLAYALAGVSMVVVNK